MFVYQALSKGVFSQYQIKMVLFASCIDVIQMYTVYALHSTLQAEVDH